MVAIQAVKSVVNGDEVILWSKEDDVTYITHQMTISFKIATTSEIGSVLLHPLE